MENLTAEKEPCRITPQGMESRHDAFWWRVEMKMFLDSGKEAHQKQIEQICSRRLTVKLGNVG